MILDSETGINNLIEKIILLPQNGQTNTPVASNSLNLPFFCQSLKYTFYRENFSPPKYSKFICIHNIKHQIPMENNQQYSPFQNSLNKVYTALKVFLENVTYIYESSGISFDAMKNENIFIRLLLPE